MRVDNSLSTRTREFRPVTLASCLQIFSHLRAKQAGCYISLAFTQNGQDPEVMVPRNVIAIMWAVKTRQVSEILYSQVILVFAHPGAPGVTSESRLGKFGWCNPRLPLAETLAWQ